MEVNYIILQQSFIVKIYIDMNGRKLFREYAQSLGKEAKEFVEIEKDWYEDDTLVTKDNQGNLEKTTLNYRDVLYWIIKTKKLQ